MGTPSPHHTDPSWMARWPSSCVPTSLGSHPIFLSRVSICSPDWSGTQRNPPASSLPVLECKRFVVLLVVVGWISQDLSTCSHFFESLRALNNVFTQDQVPLQILPRFLFIAAFFLSGDLFLLPLGNCCGYWPSMSADCRCLIKNVRLTLPGHEPGAHAACVPGVI